ncbi:hypothetical protein ACJ2_43510 [Pantoea sp. QMID2]|nr:hypothetical protein ACJ3_43380 [Pantoea sp. QMID3]GME47851.1 hypothetical protein ACJ1_43470 [Pantoea sp. QMID1]GME62678.1 hypothetical protein ACJ4_44080 [Pantoea sp. QMID4]GME63734.1 hypothetical protein ACJ2_43510 [Pantoea sp. QMID2]
MTSGEKKAPRSGSLQHIQQHYQCIPLVRHTTVIGLFYMHISAAGIIFLGTCQASHFYHNISITNPGTGSRPRPAESLRVPEKA